MVGPGAGQAVPDPSANGQVTLLTEPGAVPGGRSRLVGIRERVFEAIFCSAVVPVNQGASWWKVVDFPLHLCLEEVLAVVVGPVLVVELDEPYRVGFDVEGKVAEVSNGVRQGLEEDEGTGRPDYQNCERS